MSTLNRPVTQSQFRAALFAPDAPPPVGLTDGSGAPAGRRFSVYRNNVAVSLIEALEQTFPTVAKLIGADGFKALARRFIAENPPSSPILSRYGAAFPAFLARSDELAQLGYLPDTARLDLAMVRAYHAADAAPFDPAQLARIAPDDLPRVALALAPAVELLSSPWPIHGIWRFNHAPGSPQPPHEAQDVLVTRPDFDPVPRLLGSGQAVFLRRIIEGDCLGPAADAAARAAPDFDLSALLGLLIGDAAIARASLEEIA